MIKQLRLPLDVQRLILLELGAGHRRRLEEHHQDQTQPRTLINLSLVCRDWKDIVYPILYSSISLFDPRKTSMLLYTLEESPHLGQRIVSLEINDEDDEWDPSTFALLPNLRYFKCATQIRSDKPVVLEVKPKLLELVLRDGEEGDDMETLEGCVDVSELRSLTLNVCHNEDDNRLPTLSLFPSVAFPSLTSFSTSQDSSWMDPDYHPDSHRHLKPLLQRVLPQLLHLTIHEDGYRFYQTLPSWISLGCGPSLLTLRLSGILFVDQFFRQSFPSLTKITVGREEWQGDDEEDSEALIPRRDHGLAMRIMQSATSNGKSKEGQFPLLKTLHLRWAIWDEEKRGGLRLREEKLLSMARTLGWEVTDLSGVKWEDEWDVEVDLEREEEMKEYEDDDSYGW